MFIDTSNTILPEELRCFAMESMVRCIPQVDVNEHYTLFQIYGPFKAGIPCEMPLFMALKLKVQIEMPIYYHNQELDKMMKLEQSSEFLRKLPHDHFFEIGFILKINVKKLNDFRNIRFDKSVKQVTMMKPDLIKFGFLTNYEANLLRPLIMPLLAYLKHCSPDQIGSISADMVKKLYNDKVSQIYEE
eukprot:NODE_40_length_35084_cov_0.543519.p20 type:complete len:188 gc:universal NODE_40_length_35084_cov_0.543519:20849-21412(+)